MSLNVCALGMLWRARASKRRAWLMVRKSIFTSFSNTDSSIKLLLSQLRFTVDDFVLTCFEQEIFAFA